MNTALIEMRDIVKVFRTPAGEFPALKGVSACFYQGEFVSVVGKSGSGKSTLVNMLTGIDHPTSGEVRVEERPIHNLSENQMSLWRGRNLGIVFQFFQLLPTLTLLENVMLPMDFASVYEPRQRPERALALLRRVGLEDFADKLPGAVSGGQQQAAAVARALANDPPIVIADEPTGNLDSRTADEVFSIFTALVEQGKTVIMVTHDASLARRTGRMLLLCDGELIDTWVARALPRFAHRRLLWLTHRMQPRRFQPGEALLDGVGSDLYLVTAGNLQVSRQEGAALADLGPGEIFGPADIQALGDLPLALRAAENAPLETLVLGGGDFQSWMGGSPRGRAFLEEAAFQRWGSLPVQGAPSREEA